MIRPTTIISLLFLFVVLLLVTGMKLYKSHAYVAIFLYVVFIAWVFTTSMEQPDLG